MQWPVLELTAGPRVGPTFGRRGKRLLRTTCGGRRTNISLLRFSSALLGLELERGVEHYAG